MAASASTQPSEPARAGAALPPRILFFDGLCVFCNATVRRLMARDPAGRLHYAPLEGSTAAALRAAHPDAFPRDVDSIVYAELDRVPPRFLIRSRAAFATAEALGPLPWYLRLLRALPEALVDLGYRAFAAMRYRLFGHLDTCPIPTPEERSRILQ